MKKTIFVSAIISIALQLSASASHTQKGFYLAAQSAPLLSVRINEDDVHNTGADYKAKSSVTLGFGSGYNFTNHVGIGIEVMYSRESQGYSDVAIKYDERLSFVKVPVTFNYNTNPYSRVVFAMKVGPQVGMLTSSRVTDASIAALNGSTRDQYEKVNFGIMLGSSARIRLTNKLFADAGLRFDGIFSDLETKKYRDYHPGRGTTHSVNAGIELGIRYFL